MIKNTVMTEWRRVALSLALAGSCAAAAQAQEREPLPKVVVDARATFPKFPKDPSVATSLGVTTDNLPGRGIGGGAIGLHVYPGRLGKVTLGLGAEMVIGRASKTLKAAEEGDPDGPTVKGRFSAFAPQVSLNFGGRDGWSYVSGGLAWTQMTIERETAPVTDPEGRARTIHYGGGARWFAKDHLAFTFDIRFYRLGAQDAATGRPAYPKARLLVLSAGISLK
jgi:hypothetical protein